ncbi:MAG TPA: tetratricopeptide repeat protein [Candidatus Acidoferrales bacterium]|nr:tetratricopeptide repeat protein [Candidatus Acidoferrales bacterium]
MASGRPEQKPENATQQRVSGVLAQARQHLIRNNAKAAVALLKDVAGMPDCPPELRLEAAKMLGTAGANAEAALCYLNAGLALLYDQGDMARARQAFASAHNLDPQNLDVIFHLGQADVVEGRTQDGLAKFIDVLRKSNLKHTPALFEAGCIYQANGQYDQAILAFKKVLDREKNHIQAIVHMGQLHQIKGMIPEAIGYYLQAAQSTREAQQLGTTRQIVNMVLAIDPNNARARSMLADLDEKGDEEEAEPEKPVLATPTPGPMVAPPPAPAPEPVRATPVTRVEPAPAAAAEAQTAAREAQAAARQAQAAAQQAQAAAQEELARIQREREQADAELARLREEIDQAKSLQEKAAATAEQQERQVEAVAAAAQQRQQAELERSAAAEKQVAAERKSLDEVARARASAQAELEAVRKELTAAQGQADEDARNREAIEQATAELDERLQGLQREVERAEQRKAELDSQNAKRSAELDQKGKGLAASISDQEKRLAEGRAQMARLQTDLSKAQTAHEAAMLELAARRQRAQAELDKLQSATAEAARAKDAQHERAELSVAELDRKAAELRKELEAATARRKDAETKASAAEKHLAAVEAKAEDAKSKSETAAADLRDIVDSTHSAQATVADLQSKLAELQGQIETAEGRKRVLEDSIGKVKPLAAAAEKRRAEHEAGASAAEKTRDKREAELAALEHKKHELEESFQKTKSLIAAAERKRAEADAAADQAEALRSKREADAEALTARIAALEAALRDADHLAKTSAAESASLADLSRKVNEQRANVLALEAQKAQAEHEIAQLADELEATRKAVEEAHESLATQVQARDEAPHAEAIAAIVPVEACVESLRTIETLAADGELPIEVATTLASLIHEGRAPQALTDARKRANLESQPGPYLLVSGDLARDLGDIAAAREAYKTLAAAQPARASLAQSRMGDLFLAFAQRSTAAALARDDAHFAAAADPHKAIETYAELVARFPEDPTFREELGSLHEQLGNVTAAALAYRQALVDYLGSDDVSHAAELAPKLVAIEAGDGAAHELAARAFERAGRHADAKAALDQALRCYREQNAASELERVCRRLADIAEDPVPYRRELAALLSEAGDNAGAAEQLLEAAEKLIDWSRGNDAAELLTEATALGGQDEIVRERVAGLRTKASDVQRSVDDVARGDLLVSKGDWRRAMEAYRRAIDENPHDAGASYQLACLLMDHENDPETAERLLETASELRPHHAATRYRLALVKAARDHVVDAVELLIAMARFDESNADFIEQFAERLEKDAESGETAARYRLGIAYRELGRVDEALVILQSIQREHDYVVLCHNAIGLCLRRQGLDTAAAKRFSKAIETPGYPEAQYHEALYNLGELYEAKDTAESLALALSSFEELYASDCTFKDVGDRIKSVKSRMGAVERPKVKRLPTRTAEHG